MAWPLGSPSSLPIWTTLLETNASRNRCLSRRFLECAYAMPTAGLGTCRLGIGFMPTNTDRVARW